ncbi:hypothetical protein FOA52_009900 [Chlamydomonas sp. UWO 241]|nr:hypothetical protein FOA52_009900 [Chlamydomonas sp. UWO 241]
MGAIQIVALSLVLSCLASGAAAFREGEFIPTARKAQFHEVRTQWHDLMGSHCPRFGQERLVALPLPKPHESLAVKDAYKLQLSFDGDRHVTPWLKVLGPGALPVPVVHVTLRRAGEEILGVVATVHTAPVEYEHQHKALVDEWLNASAWPKHLLIKYHFISEREVDLDQGLYVLMAIGLGSLMLLILNAAAGSEAKLARFLSDITSEGGAVLGGGGPAAAPPELVVAGGDRSEVAPAAAWKGGGKAE